MSVKKMMIMMSVKNLRMKMVKGNRKEEKTPDLNFWIWWKTKAMDCIDRGRKGFVERAKSFQIKAVDEIQFFLGRTKHNYAQQG